MGIWDRAAFRALACLRLGMVPHSTTSTEMNGVPRPEKAPKRRGQGRAGTRRVAKAGEGCTAMRGQCQETPGGGGKEWGKPKVEEETNELVPSFTNF